MNSSSLIVSALGGVMLLATTAAPVSAYQTGGHGHAAAQSLRNHEPPDPCLRFHERRAHAHCVASLSAGKRRHERLDPYKN